MGTIPRHAEVDVVVDAPPTAVWEVVGDPRRTGEWSHECLEVRVRRRRHGACRRRALPRPQPGRAERVVAHLRDRRATSPGREISWRTVPTQLVYHDSTIWTITVEPEGARHPHHAALRGGEARTGLRPVHLPVRARAPRPHARPSPTTSSASARWPTHQNRGPPGRFPRSRSRGISMRRFRSASLAALVLTALASASVATATPASAAKAKKPATITVLVTNDDGVAAPGIDTLVRGAPASRRTRRSSWSRPTANKSGTGGKTTPGHAHHDGGDDRQRLRGHRGRRLPGRHRHRRARPARREAQRGDVGHQRGPEPRRRRRPLGHRRRRPRRPRARGIPALALSQGLGDAPQYDNTAKLAVAWLAKHRAELAKKPKSAALHHDRQLQRPELPHGEGSGASRRSSSPPRATVRSPTSTARRRSRARPPTSRRSTTAGPRTRRCPRRPRRPRADRFSRRARARPAAPSTASSSRGRCATARSPRAGCRRPRTRRARGG